MSGATCKMGVWPTEPVLTDSTVRSHLQGGFHLTFFFPSPLT
jgi:hypothetical protein